MSKPCLMEPYYENDRRHESGFFHSYFLRFSINNIAIGSSLYKFFVESTLKGHKFFVDNFLCLLEKYNRFSPQDIENYCDAEFCLKTWGLHKPFFVKRSESTKLNDFWREAYSDAPIRIANGKMSSFFYNSPVVVTSFTPPDDQSPEDKGEYYFVYMLWGKIPTIKAFIWYVKNFFESPEEYLKLNEEDPFTLDSIFTSYNIDNSSK